jgi:hypothetical protein
MIVASRRGVLLGGAAFAAAGCASTGGAAAGGESGERLFYLGGAKVHVLKPGEAGRVLVDETPADGSRAPGLNDGIAVDAGRGHVYWSNMGRAPDNDGFIKRCNLDGSDMRTIVAAGGAYTPKQIRLDLRRGKVWWSDREGMSVRRCNLDGSRIETMVATGDPETHKGDQARWCVGMALDVARAQVYWTQKGGDNAGQGVIRRASMERRGGEGAADRTDIETLFENMPEPIDLDLDLASRTIYWTDRGDNTVSCAPMDQTGRGPADKRALVFGLKEAIGVALNLERGRMAYTSLGGEVGVAKLDGSDAQLLVTGPDGAGQGGPGRAGSMGGALTGIAWGP